MMSAGSLDDESFEIKLNFIEGSIRLKKLDKELNIERKDKNRWSFCSN